MFKRKLSKEVKKRMEIELRQYWYNKQKLERLETDYKSINQISTRSILFCRERIMYIENVIKKLNNFEKQMFIYIFKYGYDWLFCETTYHISRSTYYNIYNKCIFLLAEEWGEF